MLIALDVLLAEGSVAGAPRRLDRDARAVLRQVAARVDPAALKRRVIIRSNDAVIEIFSARLIAAVTVAAPCVQLQFAPKPDKELGALREGRVDLGIGVADRLAPEVRLQSRGHVVASRRPPIWWRWCPARMSMRHGSSEALHPRPR